MQMFYFLITSWKKDYSCRCLLRDTKTVRNITRNELRQFPDLVTADYSVFELCQQTNDTAMTQKLLTFCNFLRN